MISKSELKNEVEKYYETGIISERLGEMIVELVNRFQNRKNYRNYSFLQEMKSQAIERILLKGLQDKKLNPENPNLFSYLTYIVDNAFKAYIKKEQRYLHYNVLKDFEEK